MTASLEHDRAAQLRKPSGRGKELLNDNLDYFGQTVNFAARVQGLAASGEVFATKPVIEYPQSMELLHAARITPIPQQARLKGVAGEVAVYKIES